jgi:hypothetical protein
VQHEADAPHDSGLPRVLELKEVVPQVEVWRYTKVGLAEVDECGNDGNGVRNEVYQLNTVEEEEAVEEVTRRDPESALDVREEDDGLAGPLGRELLTFRWPPADLRLPGSAPPSPRTAPRRSAVAELVSAPSSLPRSW